MSDAAVTSPWIARNRRGWSPRLYETWFERNPMQAAIRASEAQAFLGALLGRVRPEDHVLEVGPGTGHYTTVLARAAASVCAIDSSEAMLGYLRARLDAGGVSNVALAHGCATQLTATEPGYDGFFAAGVFNYIPDLKQTLSALAAQVRPGGWAVFSVPRSGFGGRLYRASERLSGRRVWTYTPEEITRLAAECGLTVETTAGAGLSRKGMTLVVGARRG